jgi:uncharacterized metal-binding protein YceD (DUF177 family)
MLADHIGVPQLRDLANRSEQIVDSVDIRDMSRLVELLHSADTDQPERSSAVAKADAAGLLDVEMRFQAGAGGTKGHPEILFKISGCIGICCQRCLGLLDSPVDLDFGLMVVGSDADLDGIAETIDVVVAGEHGVKLATLIEDEILASLPFAPMHENAAECEVEKKFLVAESKQDTATDVSKPFAGLDSLMASSHKENQSDDTD